MYIVILLNKTLNNNIHALWAYVNNEI